jgi:VanZ family protein
VILVICWLPARWTPSVDSGRQSGKVFSIDKLIHFTLFAVFGALWMRSRSRLGGVATVFLVGAMLAILTEVGQELPIVGRDGNLWDAIADVVGLGAGIVTWRSWRG